MFPGPLPVGKELHLVFGSPLKDHALRSCRKRTFQGLQWFKRNQCPTFAIEGVEVRWVVVIIEHGDHDPIELANSGHAVTPATN